MCTTKGDIMATSTKDKTILTNENQNTHKLLTCNDVNMELSVFRRILAIKI